MDDDQTEESNTNNELDLREEWFKEARAQNLETLPAFLQKLAEHEHDYGTICRAVAAAALGAACAMDRSPQGGITAFQASFVMWDFMSGWMSWPADHLGRRLLNLEELLYPQYADVFTTIPEHVWDDLRKKARERLDDPSRGDSSVRDHWQSIVEGTVPFGLRIAR